MDEDFDLDELMEMDDDVMMIDDDIEDLEGGF